MHNNVAIIVVKSFLCQSGVRGWQFLLPFFALSQVRSLVQARPSAPMLCHSLSHIRSLSRVPSKSPSLTRACSLISSLARMHDVSLWFASYRLICTYALSRFRSMHELQFYDSVARSCTLSKYLCENFTENCNHFSLCLSLSKMIILSWRFLSLEK